MRDDNISMTGTLFFRTITMIGALALLVGGFDLGMLFLTTLTAAYGQQQQQISYNDKVIPPTTTAKKYTDDIGVNIGYVPLGWTIIDKNNSDSGTFEHMRDYETSIPAVYLCPPYSRAESINSTFGGNSGGFTCGDAYYGAVVIEYLPDMDKNEDIVRNATTINQNTGLYQLNLTAQSVIDYTTSRYGEQIVQSKPVSVNITDSTNRTTWQVPGLMVLFTDPADLTLSRIGMFFVDSTTGYDITSLGPQGTAEEQIEEIEEATEESPMGEIYEILGEGNDNSTIESMLGALPVTDPRGDEILIHGIGLDNLPLVMAEPMKIMDSVSIQRK